MRFIKIPVNLIEVHVALDLMRHQRLTANDKIVVIEASDTRDASILACDEVVRTLFSSFRHQPDQVVLVTNSYLVRMLFAACFEHRHQFSKLSVINAIPTIDEIDALVARFEPAES